jgi:RNA polymerase sporulation-specific sigma factor
MTNGYSGDTPNENLSDEQLVVQFQRGDKSAGEQILVRYKNHVLAIARRFFLSGGETDDLVQEGMLGLYSAMVNFEQDGGAGFFTYAYSCVKNRIVDAVKKADNSKSNALNDFLPIFDLKGELYSSSRNPEDMVVSDEEKSELLSELKGLLSPFEYKVILMYIDGHTLAEISAVTSKSNKSIDNAITRAKRKLQNKFKAEE